MRVTLPSGEHWRYSDVPLDGSVDVGDELKAWFYDDSPHSAYFANEFYNQGIARYSVAFSGRSNWGSIFCNVFCDDFWTHNPMGSMAQKVKEATSAYQFSSKTRDCMSVAALKNSQDGIDDHPGKKDLNIR